jgi:hypothetical protein
MNSRVFVVQNQHRWDRDAGKFVPKFDLTPASALGQMVFCLSPTASPFRAEPIIKELKDKLADFSDADYLLLVGNPVLIGFATAIAADANDGNIRLLQWSGKDQRYILVDARDLFTSVET